MKKQFFVNEVQVKSIGTSFMTKDSRLAINDRPNTHATPLSLKRAVEYEPDRHRITQIGEISVNLLSFTAEFRDDGAHVFIPELVAELGKFSGKSYQEWADSCTKASDRKDQAGKPYHYIGDRLLIITEREILKEWNKASDEAKAVAILSIKAANEAEAVRGKLEGPDRNHESGKIIKFALCQGAR